MYRNILYKIYIIEEIENLFCILMSRPGLSSRELLCAGDELPPETLKFAACFCPAGACVQLWRGIRG